MTLHVLYTSHKIHLLLNFIEIDEVSVNLLHNDNKSDCHKLQKFQELYICCFSPCHCSLLLQLGHYRAEKSPF